MKTDSNYGRNFDDLAMKFDRKIYGGIKGEIRQKIIKRDLVEFLPGLSDHSCSDPLKILDAGCGSAPISLHFAGIGHPVTLCDISAKMLGAAKKQVREESLNEKVSFIHHPIQKLKCEADSFDIVFCHAVLEWVEKPEDIIRHLYQFIRPSGFLSLTFYNIDGMIFKNLLRINYQKIIKKEYRGWEGSLTPTYPRTCTEVKSLIAAQNMQIVAHSGIRVFHDYILDMDDKEKHPDMVIQLELEFSKKSPFRELGRYQHLLCRKA